MKKSVLSALAVILAAALILPFLPSFRGSAAADSADPAPDPIESNERLKK